MTAYKKNLLTFLFLAILLSSCRLGPTYHPPSVEVPEEWKTPVSKDADAPCVAVFWEVFDDEILNELERQAVDCNPSLYAALERVVEARAIAGVSLSNLYPQINLQPSYSNTGTLFKLYGLSAIPIPQLTNINPILRIHQLQYYLPFTANYELDLWGKLRGQYESACLSYQAEEEAFRTALITLTTDLAANYFNLRSLDAELQFLQETIALRHKDLELIESRYKAGLSNALDVADATLQLADTESIYEDTVRQRGLLENALATMVGTPASLFCLPPNPLHAEPPVIPSGIPSEILFQRPDIAEAERKIASENALIGVAYASYFPSISLTGTLGFFSPDLKHFLTWQGRLWSYGFNAAQMIFDGCRTYSNVQAAWSRFRRASDNYQQEVLTAFEEVENALTNIEQQARQSEKLKTAVDAASTTSRLSLNRYKSGLINYMDVVQSERLELDAKRNFINLLGQRYVSTIAFIKALGGTWSFEPHPENSFQPSSEEPCG